MTLITLRKSRKTAERSPLSARWTTITKQRTLRPVRIVTSEYGGDVHGDKRQDSQDTESRHDDGEYSSEKRYNQLYKELMTVKVNSIV